jgi:hypothetical protein
VKRNLNQIQAHISNILKEYSLSPEQYLAKEVTAFAYVSLLLEDPELVTDRQIRILRKELSTDQITAITHYVLEHVGENAYVNAFRLRCSTILTEDLMEN